MSWIGALARVTSIQPKLVAAVPFVARVPVERVAGVVRSTNLYWSAPLGLLFLRR